MVIASARHTSCRLLRLKLHPGRQEASRKRGRCRRLHAAGQLSFFPLSLRRRICLPAPRDPETKRQRGPQQLQSLCAYAVTDPDQGLHSCASICSAVLCVAVQRTRRARRGGAHLAHLAHPAFSPAKLKLPHWKMAVDQGIMTGPAVHKSTNGCMPTRAAIDAT